VHSGLVVVFLAAAGLALVAAVASALRGNRYVHTDNQVPAVLDDPAVTEVPVPPVAADATAGPPVAADPGDPARTSDDPARPPGAPVSARLAP
jgi:hypothetical protein